MQVLETFQIAGRGTGISAALVVGGLSEGRQLQAIRAGAKLVIATPGRLDDYIKRKLVNLSGVSILVLDEADRMVDMGFLPQMRTILGALPSQRQTMCFSATMPAEVKDLVHQYLQHPERVAIGSPQRHAASVKLQMFEVPRLLKLRLLIWLLGKEEGTILVFIRTKHGADKVAKKLKQAGFSSAVIHGNRSQNQRTSALKGFQSGQYRILVATDIAARGIHVDNISHVINYDLPQVPEDFIHRVGRTGRAEQSGTSVTFATHEERFEINRIEHTLGMRIDRLPLPDSLPMEPTPTHDDHPGRQRVSRFPRGGRPGASAHNADPRPHATSRAEKRTDGHPLEALWADYKMSPHSRGRRPGGGRGLQYGRRRR
jgi:ATP-dependent RNA helicase RhlE